MTDGIITRAEALAQGLTHYFTGKPCKRGHVDRRFTRNLTCMSCDREKQRDRQWHVANRERHRELNRESYQRRKDHCAEYRKARRLSDPDWLKRRWQAIPVEKRKARKREWYSKNRDHAVEYSRRWELENPDRARENSAEVARRRRARKLNAGGSHTRAEIKAILEAQGHRCAYCRADLRKSKKHLDHIMPLARGGSNAAANLQWLCAPCNLAKGAKDPAEFARGIGRLI